MSETPDTTPVGKPRLRFGLKHLLYAQAVFAASLALCGYPGLFAAVLILSCWARMFRVLNNERYRRLNSGFPEKDTQSVDSVSIAQNHMVAGAIGSTLVE